jgi:uncharacterized protein
MKIGIISDSHDQLDRIKKAIERFNREKVQLVYHLGDICSPFSLILYKDLKCSIKAVFGNNDSDIYKHLRYKPDNMEFFDKVYVDEVDGKKILIMHGDPPEIAEAALQSERYDLVFVGHTHMAETRISKKCKLVNPGSLVGPFGKWKTWTRPSIAVHDTANDKTKIVYL